MIGRTGRTDGIPGGIGGVGSGFEVVCRLGSAEAVIAELNQALDILCRHRVAAVTSTDAKLISDAQEVVHSGGLVVTYIHGLGIAPPVGGTESEQHRAGSHGCNQLMMIVGQVLGIGEFLSDLAVIVAEPVAEPALQVAHDLGSLRGFAGLVYNLAPRIHFVLEAGGDAIGARAACAGGRQMYHRKALVIQGSCHSSLAKTGESADGGFGCVCHVNYALFQHVEQAAGAPGPGADGAHLALLIGIQVGKGAVFGSVVSCYLGSTENHRHVTGLGDGSRVAGADAPVQSNDYRIRAGNGAVRRRLINGRGERTGGLITLFDGNGQGCVLNLGFRICCPVTQRIGKFLAGGIRHDAILIEHSELLKLFRSLVPVFRAGYSTAV